jgi:hypothetical protein
MEGSKYYLFSFTFCGFTESVQSYKTIMRGIYAFKLRDIQFDVVWQSVGPIAHCSTSHTVLLRQNVQKFKILSFLLYVLSFYGKCPILKNHYGWNLCF